jgi:hypothetical protein
MEEQLTCNSTTPVNCEIIFNSKTDSWIMKIRKDGIIFNRESFPYANTDDFAKAIIDILEQKFEVRFTEKYKPDE